MPPTPDLERAAPPAPDLLRIAPAAALVLPWAPGGPLEVPAADELEGALSESGGEEEVVSSPLDVEA